MNQKLYVLLLSTDWLSSHSFSPLKCCTSCYLLSVFYTLTTNWALKKPHSKSISQVIAIRTADGCFVSDAYGQRARVEGACPAFTYGSKAMMPSCYITFQHMHGPGTRQICGLKSLWGICRQCWDYRPCFCRWSNFCEVAGGSGNGSTGTVWWGEAFATSGFLGQDQVSCFWRLTGWNSTVCSCLWWGHWDLRKIQISC